ncbi:hypothetical protein M8J76_014833 [Diaphorina citri]|nr:hypothetical protein M8J75_009685 [Diaphorina citri]KAI5750337.1 hypothetical protein M8J76_014833 [Diaphorina citri]KAI5754721.1 hypothetical protein M8J77_010935 [Diaphorina citri]
MNHGRKTPSMGTPSVYSHGTTRSTANLKSVRSLHSIKIPWYQRPILQDAYFLDIQRGSLVISIYALVLSLFTVATGLFDIYCYYMSAPGSTHYGYYILSYQFVYVGSTWVRNMLVLFALFSILLGAINIVTSILLIIALRKEYEKKMVPWLYSFVVLTIFRFIAWVFVSTVNDLTFGYNLTICILWLLFTIANVYGWLLVYSLYLELADLSKLEDVARLRMGTMQSLNASTVHSLAGSRPTTPHSTVSTQPVM